MPGLHSIPVLTLHPAGLLARHAWSETERLDLFTDVAASADAIGVFAGPAEAAAYRAFVARAQRVYTTLDKPFMRSPRPTAMSLAAAAGLSQIWSVAPFATLWKALGEHFRDPRLQQLFGRYATYSGSSPFAAPATLMLIAHVEQCGVWLPQGGMKALADALASLARRLGAEVRVDAPVAEIVVQGRRACGVLLESGERLEADAIVCNADFGGARHGAIRGWGLPGRAAPRTGRTLAFGGNMVPVSGNDGVPVDPAQRVLQPALQGRIRRHFRSRPVARRTHGLCLCAGPRWFAGLYTGRVRRRF